jgi:hypothetical protein
VGLRIAADVPLEQPGGEFIAQQHRAALPLGEADQVILLGGSEHAVEDIVGRSQPLLPQLFPVIVRGKNGTHGDYAG